MEEKLLIQSERSYIKILKAIIAPLLILEIIGLILFLPMGLYYVVGIVFMIIGAFGIFSLIFYWAIAKMEINVTNKRVYGIARFGKRVDLPLDSISAVATGMLKGIAVATSSGKIHFTGISNNKEIHEVISKLLIERQGKEKPVTSTDIRQEKSQSNADELKKFKDLLDSGVITQEEFDAKKKQLLGL